MATILPRNPTILEALAQAGQFAFPGLIAGAQERTRLSQEEELSQKRAADLALISGIFGQQNVQPFLGQSLQGPSLVQGQGLPLNLQPQIPPSQEPIATGTRLQQIGEQQLAIGGDTLIAGDPRTQERLNLILSQVRGAGAQKPIPGGPIAGDPRTQARLNFMWNQASDEMKQKFIRDNPQIKLAPKTPSIDRQVQQPTILQSQQPMLPQKQQPATLGQALGGQQQRQQPNLAAILGQLQTPFGQQLAGQLLGQQLDPLRQAQTEQALARAEALRRPPIKKPETVTQIRAKEIRRLQAIPDKTPAQEASLKRLLEGQAQVQVTIGEKDIRRDTLQQRSEFAKDSRVKDIRVIEKFTRNMETAFNRSLTTKNLGPVDITLAKSFQKLTDLGSTVREGEFATTFEGQRLINKFRGMADKVIKGGLGFTQEDRKELTDLALALEQDSRKLFNQAMTEFSVTADELGLNKKAIFGGAKPFGLPSQTSVLPENQQLQIPSRENLTPEDLDNLTLEQLQGL